METTMEDRISELPEPILHHILSLIPETKFATRTSVLSKTWRSVWSRFPILDFDEKFFAPQGLMELSIFAELGEEVDWNEEEEEKCRQLINKRDQFMSFVDESLSRRRDRSIRTQKFRLYMTFYDYNTVSRVEQWIRYAVETNVKELDLDFLVNRRKNKWYNLPQFLLANNTITALSLQGCKLEPCGHIWLPLLQKLTMEGVCVDDQIFQNLISGCPLIEDLVVRFCCGAEKLIVSCPSLRTMRLYISKDSYASTAHESIEINAPNLQYFLIQGGLVPCKINLDGCKRIRELRISAVNLTNTFFEDLLSKSPLLETLWLLSCNLVERIKISSHSLKYLRFYQCEKLVEAKIDTPNLLYFGYKGSNRTSISLINTSHLLNVNIHLDSGIQCTLGVVEFLEFLRNFDHVRAFTLTSFSEKTVIIPLTLKDKWVLPLYNVKHLKLEISSLKDDAAVSVLDSLLWVFPRLDTLSIKSTLNYKSFQFRYGEQLDSKEDLCCCKSRPIKCWRHCLREVKIANFHGVLEDESNLKNFFIGNAKTLKTIHFSNGEPCDVLDCISSQKII